MSTGWQFENGVGARLISVYDFHKLATVKLSEEYTEPHSSIKLNEPIEFSATLTAELNRELMDRLLGTRMGQMVVDEWLTKRRIIWQELK